MKKVFGEFEFDERRRILRREAGLVRLTGQTLELLALLIERPGEVVTREEIQRRLWPDSNVEFDHSLDVLMNRLRSALSDSGASPRFIQTVPKRGYKFIERVSPVTEKPRVWLRRLAIYAAVAILAALPATLFARTRYKKFVPAQRPSASQALPSR